MVSRADVQSFQKQLRDVTAIAEADMRRFWNTVDVSTPSAALDQLWPFIPSLVQAYGETAALVAANSYDDIRAQAVTGAFTAAMSDPAPAEQAQRSAAWAVRPLLYGDAAQGLANALQVTQRLVLQPARATIADNAAADPAKPGWARVPSGRDTCAFCLMLSSRGAVYHSAATAGRMHQYHADCDCTPAPIFGEYPDGYDPDALYATYQAAVREAPAAGTSSTLATLRRREGIA